MPGLLGDERGAVGVVVAVFLAVLIGFAALVIDLGVLFVVRGELQNAADAGALAGVVELVINGEDSAQTMAVAFATEDGQFRLNIPSPETDAVEVTVLGPETLRVQIRRSAGTAAGPVPTIFARIWGRESMEAAAVAVTTLDHHVVGTGPGNLMPFGIHEDMVDPDGDGYYDIGNSIDIYPHSWSPGNFGILDLDGGSNSNAETAYWIENGYDGIFIIPESTGYINVEGDPGISGGSLNGAINLRYGDTVLFPVFDQVTEQGANTIYRVVDLVGGIITGFQLTGAVSSRHLTVEIVEFTAQNIVVGGDDVALNNSVSAPVLIQ
ncbi:MAG: Tad domain-containing protein [Nitrospinae bacterium]|nr:Tad domain-containing protein [Nitrospinota bacterium]